MKEQFRTDRDIYVQYKKVRLVYIFSYAYTGLVRDYPSWTSKTNSLELIGTYMSSIRKSD